MSSHPLIMNALAISSRALIISSHTLNINALAISSKHTHDSDCAIMNALTMSFHALITRLVVH